MFATAFSHLSKSAFTASSRPATNKILTRALAAKAGQAEVVLVGCGAPNRGMGWYHAVQMLEGRWVKFVVFCGEAVCWMSWMLWECAHKYVSNNCYIFLSKTCNYATNDTSSHEQLYYTGEFILHDMISAWWQNVDDFGATVYVYSIWLERAEDIYS